MMTKTPLKKCSFAAGKGSALVIDIGQTMASITPVVDGFVLRKGLLHAKTISSPPPLTSKYIGLMSSALPQLVHANAKHILTSHTHVRRGIDLYPHQLVASKMVNYRLSIDYCDLLT